MKKFITFAVNNPVTILMMVWAVMLLGKISYDKLSVDLLPDLNNPKLFVEIQTGEKPPEEIEKQFVERMESMAIRQRDVTTVSSIIKAGKHFSYMILAVYLDKPKFCNAMTILFCVPYSSNMAQFSPVLLSPKICRNTKK